jgi:hypothetical protein
LRTKLGRAVAALVAVAVTGVAIVGGCSDDEPRRPQDDPSASGSESVTPEKPPVTTQVVLGRVAGKLGEAQKDALKEDVKAILDGFFDEAYLGEFPRASYGEAYAAFTKGARDDATRDKGLLSNAKISDRIESATGVKRQVSLDVLAVKGVPQGVTARFTLDFDTAGDIEQRERVKGYLLLNREGGDWQVFGYDVIRSVVGSVTS